MSATSSHRGKWVWLEDPDCPSDLELSGGQDNHDTSGRVAAEIVGLGRDRAVEHDREVWAVGVQAPSRCCDEENTLQAMCGLQEPAPPARREDLGRKQKPPEQPVLGTGMVTSGVLTPMEPMDSNVTEEDMRDWGRAVSGVLFDLASEEALPAENGAPEDSTHNAGFLTQTNPQGTDGLNVACASLPTKEALRLSPAARLEISAGSTEEGNPSSSLASTPISGQRSTALFNEDRVASRRHHSDTTQPVGVHGTVSNFLLRSGTGLSATGHGNTAEQSLTPTEACRQEAVQRALATLSRPKSKSRLLLRERHSVPGSGSLGAEEIRTAACMPTSPSLVERPCHVQRRNSTWSEKLSDTASVSSSSAYPCPRLPGDAFCSQSSLPQPPIPSGSLRDGRRSRPSHPELHLASPALRGGDGGQQAFERSGTCSALSDASCTLDSTVPCGR